MGNEKTFSEISIVDHNLTNLRIISVDDNGKIASALNTFHRDSDPLFLLEQCIGETEALLAVVNLDPHLCIICDEDGSGNALNILTSIREAGLRPTVIVCVNDENQAIEADFLKYGAMGVLVTNEVLVPSLRFALRVAQAMRLSNERFRNDKNELVARMYEMQDARERAEEQGNHMVTMAEDLAVTKNELEILNQEKTRFFSIIAHDLKSPFTSLLGYTQLLAQPGKSLSPEKVSDFANNINESANRVFALLENLLTWAQTHMDKTGINRELIKIVDITNRSMEALAAVADDKGVEVEHELSDEACYADPNMIETVIRNLINNAIKFTNTGGHIVISARLIDQAESKCIEISVRDDGVGISAERIETLFGFSESLSTKGTAGENGTGLGLMLCKELVERNGGEIRVVSSLGEGSTFSFTVPEATKL